MRRRLPLRFPLMLIWSQFGVGVPDRVVVVRSSWLGVHPSQGVAQRLPSMYGRGHDFDTQELIIIGAAVAVVLVLAVLLIVAMVRRRSARRDHTEALRRQFGDDYDATVARLGRKPGEAELDERMHRFREMELERVSPDSRDELTERWKVVQYRFPEDPAYSVRESEHLISALMRERGFPDGGFETRARALSMAHAEL